MVFVGGGWGTCLKKAAREMDRSSKTVLDDAKMPRRTAGVTGILLDDWPGDGWFGLSAPKVEGVIVVVEDTFEWEGMMGVVGRAVSAIRMMDQKVGADGSPYELSHPPHTMQAIILS